MTVNELQEHVDGWIKTYGIRYFQPITNMVILTEEVGELARYISRIYGEQSFKEDIEDALAKQQMRVEMGDVLFVLCCLANQTGTDLTTVMKENLEKKILRDKERHKNNPKLKD